jgi:hypothetical protein
MARRRRTGECSRYVEPGCYPQGRGVRIGDAIHGFSVPSAHQDPPSYRERSAKYPSEVGKNEWSGMVLSDNPLVLLFARVASRTFLDSFKQGRVLKRRKVYTVSEGCLCSPEPQVLFRRIFP